MRSVHSMRAQKRVVVAFAIAVVLPCLVLGTLAYRGIVNDQALMQQRQAANLNLIGENVSRAVSESIRKEASVMTNVLSANDLEPDGKFLKSARLDSLISSSTFVNNIGLSSPEGNAIGLSPLAFVPDGSLQHDPQRAMYAFIEKGMLLEYGVNTNARAVAYYDSLLNISAGIEFHCQILLAAYRSNKRNGNERRAVELLQDALSNCANTYINNLPLVYIAALELGRTKLQLGDTAQADIYANRLGIALLENDIEVEESVFKFFAQELRSKFPHSIDTSYLKKVELTTDAYYAFLNNGQSQLIHHSTSIPDLGNIILFLNPEVVVESIKNALYEHTEIGWQIKDQNGIAVSGSSESQAKDAITSTLPLDVVDWELDLWPDTDGTTRIFDEIRTIYMLTFILIAAILFFGLLFTLRAIRSELALSQMKSDFVSTVSHELKSPLTSIRHLAEMLSEGRVRSEERKEEYYHIIKDQGERLTLLIDNLLDFAKLEAGQKRYDFEFVNPLQFFGPIVDTFQKRVASEGFDVRVDIHESLPELSLDTGAMTQVVNNLLDNAYKYSGEARQINITGTQVNHHVELAVSDNGCGIMERDLPHIFDKFYRAGDELTRKVKGSGIGLALVKQIIEDHQGKVEVDSTVGQGSTFRVYLPTHPNQNA